MEEQYPVTIQKWLYPFSFLYGIGVAFRNKLFDWEILRSKSFQLPVICIGNLAVGGTGKTPHTEYLVRLLKKKYQVAVLSRGYKRQTNGYLQASLESNIKAIGDEPYQIQQKFPRILVAVDEKRVRGIENLIALKEPEVDVILLDDAFQHRYIEAGLNILLTDYHRLFCEDALLPAGRLREPGKAKARAQIVIVTKCPMDMKPIDYNIITKQLGLFPFQHLFFSSFIYGKLRPAKTEGLQKERTLSSLLRNEHVLLITGIASPLSMVKEIEKYTKKVELLSFRDHHRFTSREIQYITKQFENITAIKKLIITTEKDATRLLKHPDLTDTIRNNLYILPIEVSVLQNQQYTFNNIILDYVRKNTRDSSLRQK